MCALPEPIGAVRRADVLEREGPLVAGLETHEIARIAPSGPPSRVRATERLT